ncbi:MAG: hypothetical protein ABFS12_05870 [Bacteroidota bacterium]
MNCNKINISITILLVVSLLFLFGCDMTSPSDVIEPGRLKVELVYKAHEGYTYTTFDYLIAQARDFKIYNGKNFADVFQHPDQFFEYSDSIVFYNLLYASSIDTAIQVAYGSVPPLEYDSLYFQVAPSEFVIINWKIYPISTNYNSLPIENDFSKVVKIREKIKIEENKTTTLRIEFKLEENLFRMLDDFVFNAKVDTFYIVNE